MSINTVLDAGTTWSKIIEKSTSSLMRDFESSLVKEENGYKYYVIPSSELKNINFKFDRATGHMSLSMLNNEKDYENEVIALIQGFRKYINDDAIVLDMGSRDSKWAKFKDGKFKDLDMASAAALNSSWVKKPCPLTSILAHASFKEASNLAGSFAISLYFSIFI